MSFSDRTPADRPSLLSFVVALFTVVFAASGCAAATGGGAAAPLIHPDWEHHMAAGLDAWAVGDVSSAADQYRLALHLARERQLPAEELAFSSYHLGEAIRLHPTTSRGETALALLDEARRHFQTSYGVEHPVLIPVWVRIAQIQSDRGDDEAAANSWERADRIAVRFFPASHFLRERYGAARPALMLHPLEVLHMIGEPAAPPDQVVQGS